MEQTWKLKLELAQATYRDIKRRKKSDSKINKALTNWESISHDALIIAENLNFEEILSWLDVIAPKHTDDYFRYLKKKAAGDEEKMFVNILQEKNIKSYTIPALIKKDSADISFLQSIIGNHLITISEYNDKVYYLDPTNNKFLTKDNSSIIINKKFIKFKTC